MVLRKHPQRLPFRRSIDGRGWLRRPIRPFRAADHWPYRRMTRSGTSTPSCRHIRSARSRNRSHVSESGGAPDAGGVVRRRRLAVDLTPGNSSPNFLRPAQVRDGLPRPPCSANVGSRATSRLGALAGLGIRDFVPPLVPRLVRKRRSGGSGLTFPGKSPSRLSRFPALCLDPSSQHREDLWLDALLDQRKADSSSTSAPMIPGSTATRTGSIDVVGRGQRRADRQRLRATQGTPPQGYQPAGSDR